MRISSGISQQPSRGRAPSLLGYAEPAPHAVWMRMLAAGAVFAAAAGLVGIVWHVLVLGARVRGYPQFQTIRAWQPLVVLSQVALQWVAVWILTTDDPSPRRRHRFFANVVRLSVTLLFLLLSADVLRLYEGFGWRNRNAFWSVCQVADLVATLLFWPYLIRLTLHLEFPGLAVRAGVGLVVSVVSWACLIGPRLLMRLTGVSVLTDRYFQNLAYGLDVLCSTIAVLVLLRLALRFRDEAQA
jgi:hypothetical protein